MDPWRRVAAAPRPRRGYSEETSRQLAPRFVRRRYLVAATLVTGIVYAVPVHWVWADGGCMSVWHSTTLLDVGVIDFAGSGLVHMVGGVAGLVGSVLLGPRVGRFSRKRFEASFAHVGRADISRTGRGAAAAATWIFL